MDAVFCEEDPRKREKNLPSPAPRSVSAKGSFAAQTSFASRIGRYRYCLFMFAHNQRRDEFLRREARAVAAIHATRMGAMRCTATMSGVPSPPPLHPAEIELEETPELIKKRAEQKERIETVQQVVADMNKVDAPSQSCAPPSSIHRTALLLPLP